MEKTLQKLHAEKWQAFEQSINNVNVIHGMLSSHYIFIL